MPKDLSPFRSDNVQQSTGILDAAGPHSMKNLYHFRQYDLYTKGVDGITERTLVGGIITVVSIVVVVLLLLSELSQFTSTEVVNRMYVDTDPVRMIRAWSDLSMIMIYTTMLQSYSSHSFIAKCIHAY